MQVPDWKELRRRREFDLLQAYTSGAALQGSAAFVPMQPPPSASGAQAPERATRHASKSARAKAKGNASGRTYTSKYRGVHQTFPTRRWEAQFRCGRARAAAGGAPRPGAG